MVLNTSHKSIDLFCTGSVKHLVRYLQGNQRKFICKKFHDGELHLKILEKVNAKPVWVVANTTAPADHFFELIFLLNALQRAGAHVRLFLTYFGYARQDHPQTQEAASGELIAKWLQSFHLDKVHVLHMHSERLLHALTYENHIPYDLYLPLISRFDAIVAPDHGAINFARYLAHQAQKPLITVEKHRPSHEKVKILSINGLIQNQRLLIVDDMIATGSTVLTVAKQLDAKGAKSIEVLATHGLFVNNALANLEKSPIRKIFVTNSLPQTQRVSKLRVLHLGATISTWLSSL